MLPFASALAIACLGQTLVVMQGGIDLSVAGGLSLYVVIVTNYPAGDNSRLLAGDRHRVSRRHRRRLAERVPDRPDATQPDRRDARHERVALRRRALVHGRHTDHDHRASGEGRGGLWLGIPTPVYFAVVATAVVTAVVKLTPVGRRFEGVGANETAALTAGIRVRRHRTGAYVWAQLLYCLAAVLHAGIVNQPTAHEGDNYLLRPSQRSCSAARRCSVVAATSPRPRSPLSSCRSSTSCARARRDVRHPQLVQAAALAVGVALYTDRLGSARATPPRRRPASSDRPDGSSSL